jgi:hypothetical protein
MRISKYGVAAVVALAVGSYGTRAHAQDVCVSFVEFSDQYEVSWGDIHSSAVGTVADLAGVGVGTIAPLLVVIDGAINVRTTVAPLRWNGTSGITGTVAEGHCDILLPALQGPGFAQQEFAAGGSGRVNFTCVLSLGGCPGALEGEERPSLFD